MDGRVDVVVKVKGIVTLRSLGTANSLHWPCDRFSTCDYCASASFVMHHLNKSSARGRAKRVGEDDYVLCWKWLGRVDCSVGVAVHDKSSCCFGVDRAREIVALNSREKIAMLSMWPKVLRPGGEVTPCLRVQIVSGHPNARGQCKVVRILHVLLAMCVVILRKCVPQCVGSLGSTQPSCAERIDGRKELLECIGRKKIGSTSVPLHINDDPRATRCFAFDKEILDSRRKCDGVFGVYHKAWYAEDSCQSIIQDISCHNSSVHISETWLGHNRIWREGNAAPCGRSWGRVICGC